MCSTPSAIRDAGRRAPLRASCRPRSGCRPRGRRPDGRRAGAAWPRRSRGCASRSSPSSAAPRSAGCSPRSARRRMHSPRASASLERLVGPDGSGSLEARTRTGPRSPRRCAGSKARAPACSPSPTPTIPRGLLQIADPPVVLYARGRTELLQRPGPGGRREPQSHARRCGGCRRLRRGAQQRRLDDRQRPGAGHRHGSASRRAGRRVVQHRGAGHRPRSSLPCAQPRPRAPLEQRRADALGVRAGDPGDGAEFSAPQPHHQRTCARLPGGGSGVAQRLADHGATGPRARPRGVRHPGIDPLAVVQRLSLADQARRQAGGVCAGCARRAAAAAARRRAWRHGACRAASGRARRRRADAFSLRWDITRSTSTCFARGPA